MAQTFESIIILLADELLEVARQLAQERSDTAAKDERMRLLEDVTTAALALICLDGRGDGGIAWRDLKEAVFAALPDSPAAESGA